MQAFRDLGDWLLRSLENFCLRCSGQGCLGSRRTDRIRLPVPKAGAGR